MLYRKPHRGDRESKWVNREEFSLRVPLERDELDKMQVHMQSNVMDQKKKIKI